MQLRQKIFIVLSLLTGIPMLVLLYGVVGRMEVQIQNQTEAELHTSLDKMSEELTLILNNQKSIARGLAEVPAVKNFAATVTAFSTGEVDDKTYRLRAEELENFFLNYQRAVPSIQALRFIDSRGKTLVKVKEGKPIEPKKGNQNSGRLFIADQSSKRFFRHAISSRGEVSMSDFELGQVTPGADFCPAMVRYSVMLEDELDRLDGFLVVNIWGSRFDATMETAMAGLPGRVYIVEISDEPVRDGIYLYHPDTRRRFADQMKSEFMLSRELGPAIWGQVKQGGVSGSLFLDDGRMFFYRKMSPYSDRPTQWLLLVDADRKVLLAQVNNMRQSIWVLLVVLMLMSLFLAIWASGRLAKPVHYLADIIKRYADGDHTVIYSEKRTDEVGIAGNAFNYLKQSLEQAEADKVEAEKIARQSERLASVGQLAAGIGHEINNPLMNIMSLATLIEGSIKTENEDACSDLKLLKKEGERCARIVQGILNFARENKPTYKEFSMADLIKETVSLLGHRAESSAISLSVTAEGDTLMEGDQNQLQQVLVNVMLNAIQASPDGGEISVKTWRQEGQIFLEILDHGNGIANEDIMNVFDPFFTTKDEGEGTGLGLSVSYGIINHHGGTINIENMKQAGVLVQIVLPVRAGTGKTNHQVLEVVDVG